MNHLSQRDRMRILFKSRPRQQISLTEILDLRIAQYNRVISELKKFEHMDIQNISKFKDGVHLSWYCYTPTSSVYKKQDTFGFEEKLDKIEIV